MTNKELYLSIENQLPLFFKPWWLDAVCEGEWDVAIIKEDNKIIAVWPYQLEKKIGFSIIRNPLMTAYLGPMIMETNNQCDAVYEMLWHQIPKIDFIQWTSFTDFTKSDFFEQQKLEITQRITYCISLSQSKEDIWNQIHPKRKNDIRKAELDLICKEDNIDIELFISWHKESFSAKGKKYPYSKKKLEAIVTQAAQHKSALSYKAIAENGNCLGQIWLVYDTDRMYYLLSATPNETHRGAISLLIWEAILNAKEKGITVFDFEGSMDPGIARFFQRFGGIKKHYYDFSVTKSPLWKLKTKLLG